MSERIYCMVIGDFVSSKKMNPDDRNNIQLKLKKVLNKVNFFYEQYICSRFCITLGDEFQGGLYSPYMLFEILEEIKSAIEPYKIRVGVGIGTLSTDIKYSDSFGSDGPAYYNARESIESLKKIKTHDYGYAVKTSYSEDILINKLIRVMDDYSSQWTNSQKKYIKRLNKNETLESIAERMEVSPSTISRALKRAKYTNVMSIIATVHEYMFNTYFIGNIQDSFLSNYNNANKYMCEMNPKAALNVISPPSKNRLDDLIIYNILMTYIYENLSLPKKALEYAKNAYNNINYDFRYKKISILNELGSIYADLGDINSAFDMYDEALEILKYEDELKIEKLYVSGNKANLLSNTGQYAEAEKLYSEVYHLTLSELDDYENNIRILVNRGKNLSRLGNSGEAKNMMNQAFDMANSYVNQTSPTVALLKLNYANLLLDEQDSLNNNEIKSLAEDAKKIFKKNNDYDSIKICDDIIAHVTERDNKGEN